MTDDSAAQKADPHLLHLIISLETAAMQQMGKLQNPFTGKVEKNLETARNSIDLLAMIERKTEGNLTDVERSLIKRTLYQLRMNFVDELKLEKESKQANREDRPVGEDNHEDTDSRNETGDETGPENGEP